MLPFWRRSLGSFGPAPSSCLLSSLSLFSLVLAVLLQRSVCKRRLTAFKSINISISISVTHVAERSCSRISELSLAADSLGGHIGSSALLSRRKPMVTAIIYSEVGGSMVSTSNNGLFIVVMYELFCTKYQKQLERR